MRKYSLTLIFTIIMSLFSISAWGKETTVDFNFPQDVSKNALADLDQALKTGDGEMVVDAIVRHSIAQSGISEDNLAPIVERIETTIASEQRPEIKALLYYFEALVLNEYCNNTDNVHHSATVKDEQPSADFAEWNMEQFRARIEQLLGLAVGSRPDLEQVAITAMPRIIKCDELGATYVPNLYVFLAGKCREMTDNSDFMHELKNGIMQSVDGNIPATIYAHFKYDSYSDKQYERYKDNEHSALLLIDDGRGPDKYKDLKDYLARFPKSIYATDIQNLINYHERRDVELRFPETMKAGTAFDVVVESRNTNALSIDIYRLSEEMMKKQTYSLQIKDLEKVRSVDVAIKGIVPFSTTDTVKVEGLSYGKYVLVPSYEVGGEKQNEKVVYSYNLLTITDMAVFTVQHKSRNAVYVVDHHTGAPMSGVSVKVSDGDNRAMLSFVTDKDGALVIPNNIERGTIKVEKGADRWCKETSYHRQSFDNPVYPAVSIFTDLGIYRPGETIKWAVIAYKHGNNTRNALTGKKLKLTLRDANGKEVSTEEVTTDEWGRAEGTHNIPTDRLNGTFTIEVRDGKSFLARKHINVSEYKTPTFEVMFTTDRSAFVPREPVVIEGKAESYSGMPIAGSEVKVSVTKSEWMWNWRFFQPDHATEALSDTIVTTDAKGNFKIELPAELFEESRSRHPWARNNYAVTVQCTNATGETQEASKPFIVGSRRGIELNTNADIAEATKHYKVPVTYQTTSETEKSVVCTYEIKDKYTKDIVATGNFDTADPTIDLAKVPSGEYTLKVHILAANENEWNVDDEMDDLVVYRTTDKQAPVKECPLWIPERRIQADDKGNATLTIGTSTPNAHVYYIVSSHAGVEKAGWTRYAPGLHKFTLNVPNRDEEALKVELISYYNGKLYHIEDINVECKARQREIKLTATSFRDKLTPGAPEKWTFTVTDRNGNPVASALMLEMMDKALNNLVANPWGFTPTWLRFDACHTNTQYASGTSRTSLSYQARDKSTMRIEAPELYLYGQTIFGNLRRFRDERMVCYSMKAAPMSENSTLDMARVITEAENATGDGVEEESARAGGANDAGALDNVTMRLADVKTALWQPMLTTDANGTVAVEFEAPQFNTTWIVQGVAWDKGLYSSMLNREVLTQKNVMVKAALPRFVRSGDKAQLAASVMNATDEPLTADAVIELFDPRTNEIIATRSFKETLAAHGTNAVRIDWDVPSTMPFVGFRIKAASGLHNDGEQVMLPVLASTQPVIETQPFYIEQGAGSFSLNIQHDVTHSRLTLEYCDNPAWYCVTALPTLFDDNYKITTVAAHTLFTIDVAQGVARSNPKIKEAVDHWNAHPEDSVLVSMLDKNSDLKIGTLLASPWLRESDRQTLRMSQLGRLFDEKAMAAERKKIIDQLIDNQMPDGGWCWYRCPLASSSVYTTHSVLEIIGEIKHMGFLPADERLDKAVKAALRYYDNETVRQFNERTEHSKKKDYSGYSHYVYVRSLFKETAMSKDAKDLFDNALKTMKKDWGKGLSHVDKAYYALTLERNNEHKTAAAITESLRQFSITKPALGTYWDNLQSGWRYFDKVAVTARILQALYEVDNRQSEVDNVRKWMLLMKQTNDWGSSSLAADAVYTLLTTGTQWLQPASKVSITVDGKPLDISDQEKYLGYVKRSLEPVAGATVAISRDGTSPAWGAIYNQFTATMTQVKQVSIEEMSIGKEYYVYDTGGKLVKATNLKVGDKVQVRTIIKCNRDLDFVTVVDERAACFEPADQLSGYRYDDHIYYYLETKDSRTNVFYSSLPKGTHIISYDVFVTAPGTYSAGIASAQCQYAPQIAAHSAGTLLEVK